MATWPQVWLVRFVFSTFYMSTSRSRRPWCAGWLFSFCKPARLFWGACAHGAKYACSCLWTCRAFQVPRTSQTKAETLYRAALQTSASTSLSQLASSSRSRLYSLKPKLYSWVGIRDKFGLYLVTQECLAQSCQFQECHSVRYQYICLANFTATLTLLCHQYALNLQSGYKR